jgi:hypothetical protein
MTSLENACIKELQLAGVIFERDSDGALRVPARFSEVGDLVIAFDDGEITVYVGELTHSHFTPETTDQAGTQALGNAAAAAAAVEFVAGIVADQFVIWRYPSGGGGCYPLSFENHPMADTPIGDDAQCYLWSRPYVRGGAA